MRACVLRLTGASIKLTSRFCKHGGMFLVTVNAKCFWVRVPGCSLPSCLVGLRRSLPSVFSMWGFMWGVSQLKRFYPIKSNDGGGAMLRHFLFSSVS
jgi:hypothetical protein